MKTKLKLELSGEEFVGKLSVDVVDEQRRSKSRSRPELSTPKIVVCPPMEETATTVPAPRSCRLSRGLISRLSQRSVRDANSMESSSSSDSVVCEAGRSYDNSCSTSESGSDGSDRHRRNRSSVSLRRMFQSLNLSMRSQSCSPNDQARQPKKNPQPKRLLRTPVSYTYVRGLSGLPTQRVPRHTVYHSDGLNR